MKKQLENEKKFWERQWEAGSAEAARKAARWEAFQQMARVLSDRHRQTHAAPEGELTLPLRNEGMPEESR